MEKKDRSFFSTGAGIALLVLGAITVITQVLSRSYGKPVKSDPEGLADKSIEQLNAELQQCLLRGEPEDYLRAAQIRDWIKGMKEAKSLLKTTNMDTVNTNETNGAATAADQTGADSKDQSATASVAPAAAVTSEETKEREEPKDGDTAETATSSDKKE